MRPLLFSDIDGTFLDSDQPEAVRAGWLEEAGRAVDLVFVSSRTVAEIRRLFGEWGWSGDGIGENGADCLVSDPALAEALESGRTGGDLGEGRVPSPAGGGTARLLRQVRDVAAGSGLALPAVHSAGRRSSCLIPREIAEHARFPAFAAALRAGGLHVAEGGEWVSVWFGRDKGAAARSYVEALDRLGRRPPLTGAVGNAENDLPLLASVPHRYVIREPGGGHHTALLALPGAVPLDAPGTLGWPEAVRRFAAAR